MTTKTITTLKNLDPAYKGSYYTILGAGGDLNEWIVGYEDLLEDRGIGKPVTWYKVNGEQINRYAERSGLIAPNDLFQPDLVCLMFPLTGLDVTKLAIFKVQMEDRWFDDIVQNMR